MPRPFGATPHSEIARAFERENRQHTYVEQMTTGEFTKKYELRLSVEELLALLDSLAGLGSGDTLQPRAAYSRSEWGARQLRGKILGTLGLFEEG
jgi:hypothetical protein